MLIEKIVIGCDHAGYALKEQIKQYLPQCRSLQLSRHRSCALLSDSRRCLHRRHSDLRHGHWHVHVRK